MGKEKFIDSTILDKAIKFALEAHKNTERRGKGVPYIVHPLEVLSIVSSLTKDQEVLAAAVLHDTVEDTKTTIEDIKKEFGDRVADIVANESESPIPGKSDIESWKERKQNTISRLKNSSLDCKIVALGDKLSNIRTIHADFNAIGDKLWERFHNTDPKEHEWHYRGLADSLSELSDTEPYKEFVNLIDDVFSRAGKSVFKFSITNNVIKVVGNFNGENSRKIEKELTKIDSYIFDFSDVTGINFAGVRTLLRLYEKGMKISVIEATNKVAIMFYRTGTTNFIKVNEKFKDFDLKHAEVAGEGFTAVSYNVDDNDSMFKLYSPMVGKESINREKQVASSVIKMGIPTPLSGNLIKVGNQYGISFERILTKKSFSRLLSEHPENVDKYAKKFAELSLHLHTTQCDTYVFENIVEILKRVLKVCPFYNDDEKKIIVKKLDELNGCKTCLHGDFHIGNIIVTDDDNYLFIDLADFCYGNPKFDLAMLYLICNEVSEKHANETYHTTKEVLGKFWKSFIKYYMNDGSEENLAKINDELSFFVSMRTMCIAWMSQWNEFMCKESRKFFGRFVENEK